MEEESRLNKEITCTLCPNGCSLSIFKRGKDWQINGYLCHRGKQYALDELTEPKRTVCSTVKTTYPEYPRLPVRTDRQVRREDIFKVMEVINSVTLDHPVHSGEIIVNHLLDSNVNLIATSDLYQQLERSNNNGRKI